MKFFDFINNFRFQTPDIYEFKNSKPGDMLNKKFIVDKNGKYEVRLFRIKYNSFNKISFDTWLAGKGIENFEYFTLYY